MKKSVVIIDDDPISILVTETLMKKKDFAERIKSFERPEDALDYFENLYSSENHAPDYIFLDIQMPTMSGWDFLDNYEKLTEKVKALKHVIMLSATFSPEDTEKAKDHDLVKELVTKPVNGDILAGLS